MSGDSAVHESLDGARTARAGQAAQRRLPASAVSAAIEVSHLTNGRLLLHHQVNRAPGFVRGVVAADGSMGLKP